MDDYNEYIDVDLQSDEVGSVYLPGEVIVSDFWIPTSNPWCLTIPVKKGNYRCVVTHYVDHDLGDRTVVHHLTIIHEDFDSIEEATDIKDGIITVDCNLAGFFVKKPSFANDDEGGAYIDTLDKAGLEENRYVLTENEFLSYTGLGDDMYTVTTYEEDGEIFAIDICYS